MRTRAFSGSLFAVALLASACSSAFADLSITRLADDQVRVEVQNTPLEDVFFGLNREFGLGFRSEVPLDRVIEGSYSGSLPSVVKDLLQRYDYVLKKDFGTLSLQILSVSSGTVRVGALSADARWQAEMSAAPDTLATYMRTQLQPLARAVASSRTPGMPGAQIVSASVAKTPRLGQSSQASVIADLTKRAQGAVKTLATALKNLE